MQEKQAQESQKVMVPINPTLIDTPTGSVMVWGFEHVSAKMLDVLKIMLSHDPFESVYHGVKSMVFRTDNYPKKGENPICASFSPDVCGIAINMDKTLERSLDRSMKHPETSLFASWWIEMLLNFGHELHHGVRWDTDGAKLHNKRKTLAEEDEEERAEKYANTLIIELAQEYDIEIPDIKEEVWFNNQISELFEGKNDSDKWGKSQKEMITEKIIWKHEPKNGPPVRISTFKDLICLISDGDTTAEEWNKPTIPLTPNTPTLDTQLNGKTITTNAAGEQGEVVQPVTPAVAAPNSATGIYVNEIEDYDIYEESEEYNDDENNRGYGQPITSVQPTFDKIPETPQAESQIDIATINKIAKGVYMKMYNFIFKNCGPLRNSDVGFSNPEAVLTTLLPLTPEESEIFVSMDHMDVNGRWCPGVSTANGLLGKVMKNTKLPCYEVTLNVNGAIHQRLFIPQNPNKRPNGVLTQRALETRAGDAIAYIIVKDDETNNKWGPYIINGEYRLPREK